MLYGEKMNQSKAPQNIKIDFGKFSLNAIAAIVLSALIAIFILYFNLPVLSFRFLGWVPFVGMSLLPLLGIRKIQKVVGVVYILMILCLILLPFFSSGMFHAAKYRGLIHKVENTEFSDLVSPIEMDRVPIIDLSFAASLAEKKLGEDFALGSRVNLGTPTIQTVNNRLYWVVPLLHSGFFKWLSNTSEGTPGYIMVSATNPQDITFVREINGKPINIRYQRASFFAQDLNRHLYMNGFSGIGLAGDTFELDDKGEPYWTITTYSNKIGVRGADATGLATVHAGTGEIKYYPLIETADGFSDKNIPAWVDRVQPSYFVMPQLNWWGKYVRGFWNTLFGKRDMLLTTEGYNVIYGKDNRSYFYTGLTSVGADEGTVGFALTDTRTKATALYRVSGATEYAAMQSAEGKVQQYRYHATFPILVNLNGIPTYFMTLKDAAGLVKMFCFVSVKDFSLVGVGESLKAARESYQMNLASAKQGTLEQNITDIVSLSGSIKRMGSDIKDGRTFYYFSVVEAPKLIFVATSNLSSYLPLTNPGDQVRVEYLKTTETEINISEFQNLSFEE